MSLRRSVLPLLLLFGLLLPALAEAQVPFDPSLYGYVEGRIVSLEPGASQAVVALRDGPRITANLPGYEALGVEVPPFEVGDRVELYFSPSPSGEVAYVITDWVRRPALLWLLGLFFLVAVVVGRAKGLRAFLATGASLGIAIGFVVPAILAGWSPVLISLLGSGGILVLAIFFVHGVNWSTTAALIGTFLAVIVTMVLGVAFSNLANITGLGTEEAMMINLGAEAVDLRGLMLAALLIGALGALTDITIVQASVIRELAHVNPGMSLRELYRRGMGVGLDHVGSLIDTLVLAYTGAALPLLVLLHLDEFGWRHAVNLELVAAEVIHTLVGAIGLVLAVPLTTFLAAYMFRGDRIPVSERELAGGHSHHHH